MALVYTNHASERMTERGITAAECEAAVANDKHPWETVLTAGNHLRFHYESVTVITNIGKTVVVTAFKGDPGGWNPANEGL